MIMINRPRKGKSIRHNAFVIMFSLGKKAEKWPLKTNLFCLRLSLSTSIFLYGIVAKTCNMDVFLGCCTRCVPNGILLLCLHYLSPNSKVTCSNPPFFNFFLLFLLFPFFLFSTFFPFLISSLLFRILLERYPLCVNITYNSLNSTNIITLTNKVKKKKKIAKPVPYYMILYRRSFSRFFERKIKHDRLLYSREVGVKMLSIICRPLIIHQIVKSTALSKFFVSRKHHECFLKCILSSQC